MLDRGMLNAVEHERRLAHRGTGGDDHEVAALKSRREPVEVEKAARHPGDDAVASLELLDPLHRRPDQLLEAGEILRPPELRHLEDAVLGVVEHFPRLAFPLVYVLDDLGGG